VADFVLGDGLFSRALGNRGFRDDIQSHNKNNSTDGRQARGSLLQRENPAGTLLPLNEALRIAAPKVEAAPALAPPLTNSPPDNSGETSLDEGTIDKLVPGYVDFLKSINFYSSAANDPQTGLMQADDLVHRISEPLGISESDIQELTLTSDFTLAEVYQQYVSQNGGTTDAGASYSAAAHAHLTADILTKDGRAFHVELTLDAQMSQQIAVHREQSQSAVPANQCDPLTLDLNGDGEYSLSDVSGGLAFDINADGRMDQSAFVQGDDAFLALDRNGNGRIDDGAELFGDQHGAKNGYAELAKFDSDANGKIDSNDAVFAQLLALRRATDGSLSQTSLSSLGIDSLSLEFQSQKSETSGGNTITENGQFFRSSIAYKLADINLGYETLSKEA